MENNDDRREIFICKNLTTTNPINKLNLIASGMIVTYDHSLLQAFDCPKPTLDFMFEILTGKPIQPSRLVRNAFFKCIGYKSSQPKLLIANGAIQGAWGQNNNNQYTLNCH